MDTRFDRFFIWGNPQRENLSAPFSLGNGRGCCWAAAYAEVNATAIATSGTTRSVSEFPIDWLDTLLPLRLVKLQQLFGSRVTTLGNFP